MQLRAMRIRKGKQQKELAKAIGTDEPMMSKFENYKCLPIPPMMTALCRELGCEVEDIYEPHEVYLSSPKATVKVANGKKKKKDCYHLTVNLPPEARKFFKDALQKCGFKDITACYIADSRFKYTSEDDIDGSFNYEWWYWTNTPVRVWAVVDNQLYFGTKDGQVCVFDEEYIDRTHQKSQAGDLSLDMLNNRITYNEHIRVDLAENDIITFSTSGIYALVLRDFTVKDNKIYVTAEEIVNITEGTEVYADTVGESGLSLNTKYLIHEIDKGACCFGLIDDNGNEVAITGSGFRLCKYISQKTLYLSNITETAFQLKEYRSGEVLILTNYNNTLPTSIIAKVTHRENVVAEWYTPIFDLGTNESSKTLLKMTISTNPEINGKLSFGYETRSVNKLINAKGINVFSFDNFSFENFSFETGFANSYSVKCNERNFNFIIFRFVSDNDSDCIVNTFTVLYKINKSNKGVE